MFDLLVAAPRAGTRIMLVIGLLIAIGSGLAGPSRRRSGSGAVSIVSPVGPEPRPARSTPSPRPGVSSRAHFKAFVGAVIAIGVLVMLAIDRLTAKQVLWIAVGVGVSVVVLAILAASRAATTDSTARRGAPARGTGAGQLTRR